MILLAIDNSINSAGALIRKVDDQFNLISQRYLTFSKKKPFEFKNNDGEFVYFDVKKYADKLNVYEFMHSHIFSMIEEFSNGEHVEYVAFENYAFAANGKVFHIAESTGILKNHFFMGGSKLRFYPIGQIKKFITGDGSADKVDIELAIDNHPNKLVYPTKIPLVRDAVKDNPSDNTNDAFAIMELLVTDLKLRHGFIAMSSLSLKQIEVFNSVSKEFKTNLLVQPFVQRNI